jgi:anti-sigma28 factor (negative regulator of flagellin synthesis)
MTGTTLQDWESLARSAYQAMSLAQFENSRGREIKLTPREQAQLQVEIDKLKNEIVAKERKVEEIKQKIETGDYTVQTKAIAQNAIKDLESTREAYLELTMNRVPGKANKDIAAPTATPKPTTPVAQAPAAETPEQRRRRLQALAQQNADRSATPVATPTPGFGKGTPMSMNPYQVPGARTTATPVKPATPAPTGPRVVAGGPTPAEREQLARRIAQASGTKV